METCDSGDDQGPSVYIPMLSMLSQNIISGLVSCQCLRALASELPCVPTLVMLGYEQSACSNAASGDSSAVNILQFRENDK